MAYTGSEAKLGNGEGTTRLRREPLIDEIAT